MDEKYIYLLLKTINNNGTIKRLTREGISYNEIAELTNTAILNNLITYENDIVYLSKQGVKKLVSLDKQYKLTDKSKWIDPEKQSRIAKLDKNDVHLPSQDELWF